MDISLIRITDTDGYVEFPLGMDAAVAAYRAGTVTTRIYVTDATGVETAFLVGQDVEAAAFRDANCPTGVIATRIRVVAGDGHYVEFAADQDAAAAAYHAANFPAGVVTTITKTVADPLDAARADRIDKLWRNAYDFNFKYFSGGAYAQILELKLAGSPRAIANQNWILSLWGDYYGRKAAIASAATQSAIDDVSLDFSAHGAPPWSVLDMLTGMAP